MKRSRYTEEQIAYALRQAEAGTLVGDVHRHIGVLEVTFYVEAVQKVSTRVRA